MSRRRTWRWFFTVVVAGAFLFVAVSWIVGGRLVASANRMVGPPPSGLGMETISIRSGSGGELAGWYAPRKGASATVLLLHPFHGDRRAMLERAKLLLEAGYAVLLIDLQAHGESPGEQITMGFREREDVIAAVDFIRETSPGHRIGVIGWSLGGASALLASPLEIDALVLESVFPSLEEAVHNRVSQRLGGMSQFLAPVLLAQLEPRLGFDPSDVCPIERISEVGCPVLVASGDRDQHTTLAETERLFAAAREPKQLVIFSGAEHVDLLNDDPKKYQEIMTFLDHHLRGVASQEARGRK